MMTIWKYRVGIEDKFRVNMPRGARVLSVQTQGGSPVMWALVDQNAPIEQRAFHLVGTGNPADSVGAFIGTFQTHDGALVWHLFEA